MPFTCPICGRVSYNPNDEKYRYCGACHLFVDDFAPSAQVGFTWNDVDILSPPKVPRLEAERLEVERLEDASQTGKKTEEES
jgi:hypothetical protein